MNKNLDYIKKKYGIKHFNTGGFVNSTSESVEGKDSIFAKLTPKEYVMRAPVVKKLGRGFFDALNNFKIPHFNTGGFVSGIGESSVKGGAISEQVIRHALDLSINGQKQGELTGSSMTIEKILNDLTLAKLRS